MTAQTFNPYSDVSFMEEYVAVFGYSVVLANLTVFHYGEVSQYCPAQYRSLPLGWGGARRDR